MAISQTISSFPTAPDRENDTPSEFSDNVDAYLQAVVDHVSEVNTWATQANSLVSDVNSDASDAATSETNAAASEAAAQSSANYVGEWDDQSGAATVPTCVSHNNIYWQLTEDLGDITAKEPGVDSEWIVAHCNARNEVAKTQAASPYAATVCDLLGNTIFSNAAATDAVEITLLAGAEGYGFRFYVAEAQYLKFTANGSETFRYGSTQSAAGGYIRSNTIGRSGIVEWVDSQWVIHFINGAVSVDE